ncbi:glycosylphosphatidylinositol anchor biosynthesis [Lecanora helva]
MSSSSPPTTPMSQASTRFGVDSSISLDDVKSFRRRAVDQIEKTSDSQDIFLFLVAFRILNALSVKTFFQPDEFFQSLEPAWEIAFGAKSGAWITWEWKNHLRSTIHPVLFAIIYKVTSGLSWILRLSPSYRADILVAAPKITQAAIAALGDFYTWKLGERTFGTGSNESWAAFFLTVCSPWQWFCSTRTLSNSLETTLTTMALALWPWQWSADASEEDNVDEDGLRRSHQQKSEDSGSESQASQDDNPATIDETSKFLVLLLSTLVDRLYYQCWTFPPFRFLYFNLAQSLAVFYGRNDWHYYLSQGYPLLLTIFLPFGIVGVYQSLFSPDIPSLYSTKAPSTKRIKYQLAAIAVLVPFMLSFISHKEVRFIYPLLPLLHILVAAPFTAFFLPAVYPTIPNSISIRTRRFILAILLFLGITIALLTTTSHQTAPLSVMTYLRDQHAKNYLSQPPSGLLAPAPSTMTVGFLMPCHSTPWRSHLVFPSIKAWALTCEPPINFNASARASYLDEADQFYAEPKNFLAKTLGTPPRSKKAISSWLGWFSTRKKAKGGFGREDMIVAEAFDGREGRKTWPEYLVFFEQMEPILQDILKGSAYRDCWRGWNSWGHDDWRRKGDIIVWCLRKQGAKQKTNLLW